MPYNILFATETGAAGKTTGAIELSTSFGLNHKKIVLIGLDENAELSKFLGININHLEHSTADIFKQSDDLHKISFKIDKNIVGSTNISVVPSTHLLISAIEELRRAGKNIMNNMVSDYIEQYHQEKDFAIIDSPPGLSKIKVNCIVAADLIIIPCKLDPKTSEATLSFIEQIKAVKGNDFTNYAVLLTNVDIRKKKMIRTCKEKLKNLFDQDRVFLTQIPTDIKVEYAQEQSTQKSVQVVYPNSNASEAYKNLAKEILRFF